MSQRHFCDHETAILRRFSCPKCGGRLVVTPARRDMYRFTVRLGPAFDMAVCHPCGIGITKENWDRERAYVMSDRPSWETVG